MEKVRGKKGGGREERSRCFAPLLWRRPPSLRQRRRWWPVYHLAAMTETTTYSFVKGQGVSISVSIGKHLAASCHGCKGSPSREESHCHC